MHPRIVRTRHAIARLVRALRHQDVGDVRRPSLARDRRLRSVGGERRAGAATVAAILVSYFERSHHAIGQRPLCGHERPHRIGNYFTGPEDVALDRIVDLRSGHATLNVLRHVPVRQTRMSGAAASEIHDPELPRLKRRIRREHLDDTGGIGTLHEFVVHQHLVRPRAVHRRLTRRHALARHDHGLHTHQKCVVTIDARCRCDDDAAGRHVHSDHRPCGAGARGQQNGQRERKKDSFHW